MTAAGLRTRRLARLVVAVLVLAGCAGRAAAPRPADFPVHELGQQLDLHWRLTESPTLVRVDGLVERRTNDVWSASLQLVGLDSARRIVSFSAPYTVYWGSGWDTEPFELTLRPTGREQEFGVRVQSFEYQEGMRGGR